MASFFWGIAVAAGATLAAGVVGATEAPPLAGCYERVYDAAYMSRHKGQIVVRATISIEATRPGVWNERDRFVADGSLNIWVRGRSQSFDSHGVCRAEGNNLHCNGSLSAAEADTCKSKRDGVRQCRIDSADAGTFSVEGKPDGVLVSIRERLELVPAPYDGGPFLNLSRTNAENHAFLLKKTACK